MYDELSAMGRPGRGERGDDDDEEGVVVVVVVDEVEERSQTRRGRRSPLSDRMALAPMIVATTAVLSPLPSPSAHPYIYKGMALMSISEA